MSDAVWYVAHTLPRREKKLLESCVREELEVSLPCVRTVHKYRGKTVTFQKPLFPGYLFVRMPDSKRQWLSQNEHVARVLTVFDQDVFVRQLEDILRALETEMEIRLAPEIGPGRRVRIKRGPLQGMEAWVEDRQGTTTVMLRLDFIGQAAAVNVPADHLELV